MRRGPIGDDKSRTFPATRWTMVVASRGSDTNAHRALEDLCRSYWYPIYSFAREMNLSPADAEDAAQNLFQRLVDKDITSQVEPGSGKFRSYLMACLKNEIRRRHRWETQKKRGGGARVFSFDQMQAEGRFSADSVEGETPRHAFERRWATALLDSALARLGREYERRNELPLFKALSPLLVDADHGTDYKSVAKQIDKSEGAVRVAVFRLRKRYRRAIHDEIRDTVASPEEEESEIEALFSAFTY